MQRTRAIDGVEWSAADMTFDQDGRETAITDRTQLWAGTGGVFTGGLVTVSSGLTLAVSGPLKFHANGQLGQITSPANVTVANGTNYIVAIYGTTDDTAASYYGGGSPPNLHRHDNPTVVSRQSGAAVLGSGEVDLASVVVAGGVITVGPTDTRIILPTVSAGNISLGAGNTVDGVDVSVHAATVGSAATAGHLKLAATGGAAKYDTLRGAWKREAYYDVGATFAATKILDDADFSAPPASSEPFFTTGSAYNTQYLPTRQGDLMDSVYGPRLAARYTLSFTATAAILVSLGLAHFNDTIRVKANGVTLTSHNAASEGQGEVVSFTTAIGSNTIIVYGNNTGAAAYHVNLISDLLTDSRITFTG